MANGIRVPERGTWDRPRSGRLGQPRETAMEPDRAFARRNERVPGAILEHVEQAATAARAP